MTAPSACVITLCQEFTLLLHSLNPSLASIFTHITPPQRAMSAAISNEAVHPQWSASQGVRLGEITPPTFAPMFITPDRVPACVLERSVVTLQ